MKKAAIFGAGGHARVVASILKANKIQVMGLFDDSFCQAHEEIQEAPVLGKFNDILSFKKDISDVYLAIGDNLKRRCLYAFLKENKFSMPSLIHPRSYVEDNVSIKDGAIVCMGAMVCADVKIGEGVIINTGSSVDHESSLADFVHIGPGAIIAGRVKIGSDSFVGMNVSVKDKIVIGSKVVIGAGAIVLKDVSDNTTVVGIWK